MVHLGLRKNRVTKCSHLRYVCPAMDMRRKPASLFVRKGQPVSNTRNMNPWIRDLAGLSSRKHQHQHKAQTRRLHEKLTGHTTLHSPLPLVLGEAGLAESSEGNPLDTVYENWGFGHEPQVELTYPLATRSKQRFSREMGAGLATGRFVRLNHAKLARALRAPCERARPGES